MNKVELGTVANIITGPFGSQLHMSDYVDVGIPVIMPQNISDRRVTSKDIAYITEEDFERLKKYATQENDLIYARRGDVEKHAFIGSSQKMLCGTGCLRIRVKSDSVFPLYLSFYLSRPETRRWISTHAVGSNMPNLNVGILEKVPIELPEYSIQTRIAEFLQRIDQKIENNNRINDNLQRQLKLLYDYWFTQFDFPDETGRPYRTSGGKMQTDPTLRRPIPVGWEVETLKNNRLASLIPTGVERFQTKIYYATADVIGTDIGNGSPIAYETRENRANMQPTMFSVWFAKMKKSIKHLFLNREMQDFIQNSILSTGFCGLQCTENYFEYVASFIEHSYFEATKDVYAHGATQEAVNNGDLAKIVFIVPPEDVLLAYHEKTKHLYSQISHNKMENKKLIDLRDWLLPLLMNGQATLAD